MYDQPKQNIFWDRGEEVYFKYDFDFFYFFRKLDVKKSNKRHFPFMQTVFRGKYWLRF